MLSSKLKLKRQELNKILIKKEEKLFKIIKTDFFDIKIFYYSKNKGTIIVSKKTFKKAVERNKIKRLFYSILELYFIDKLKNKLEENKIEINYAFIFYPKKISKEITFEKLKEEVYNNLNFKDN